MSDKISVNNLVFSSNFVAKLPGTFSYKKLREFNSTKNSTGSIVIQHRNFSLKISRNLNLTFFIKNSDIRYLTSPEGIEFLHHYASNFIKNCCLNREIFLEFQVGKILNIQATVLKINSKIIYDAQFHLETRIFQNQISECGLKFLRFFENSDFHLALQNSESKSFIRRSNIQITACSLNDLIKLVDCLQNLETKWLKEVC